MLVRFEGSFRELKSKSSSEMSFGVHVACFYQYFTTLVLIEELSWRRAVLRLWIDLAGTYHGDSDLQLETCLIWMYLHVLHIIYMYIYICFSAVPWVYLIHFTWHLRFISDAAITAGTLCSGEGKRLPISCRRVGATVLTLVAELGRWDLA